MTRYIDADAYISDLEHDVRLDSALLNEPGLVGLHRELTQFDKDFKANIIAFLKEAPTVDAVPVTRCKDCKHRDWDVVDIPYGLTKHIEWCSIRFNADGENIEVSPNDFCSKAESKVSSNFE